MLPQGQARRPPEPRLCWSGVRCKSVARARCPAGGLAGQPRFGLEIALASISLGALALFVGASAYARSIASWVRCSIACWAEVAVSSAALDGLTGSQFPSSISLTARARPWVSSPPVSKKPRTGLRTQVEQSSVLNRELAETREELLRAERLAVVGRLAAGVAHEIGNPLGALIGFAGLLSLPDQATRAEADGIEGQAQRIHRTLQELMDFARAGKMTLAPVQLSLAVETAVKLVKAHPRWREML